LGKTFLATGAIYKTVQAYAEFEKQLANVSTMLDEHSMRLMPAYTAAMKRMAIEFGEGTETLSKGLYDILSASVAPEQALSVLEESIRAAKAGMTDTAVAADAITTILNSYGMSADKAGKVSDILFGIIKRGKTTFAELGPSIGKVASIAAAADLSLEELGAAIATLTRAGLQTDIAITSLRSILNAFLKPTKESIDAAAKFGIELNTTTLRTIGLVEVLKKLRLASAEQLAQIIPNTRGLAGLAAALKQVDEQAKDLEIMLNSAGMTQEAYEKTTDTLSHSLDRARQAFKLLSVEIGEELQPVIDELALSMADLAGILAEPSTAAEGAMGKREAFYSGLLEQIANLIDPLGNLQKKMGTHPFWRMTRGTGIVATALEKLSDVLENKANKKLDEFNQLNADISSNLDKVPQAVSNSTLIMSKSYTELEDKIISFNKQIEKQTNLFGLAGLERQIRDLTSQFELLGEAERNALQPQIDRMNRLIERYNALEKTVKASEEAQRKEETISRKIEDVINSTLTPLEKYEKRIGELNELLEYGLPWENYGRAVRQAREELERATDDVIRFQKQAGEFEEIRLAFIDPRGLSLGFGHLESGVRTMQKYVEQAKTVRRIMPRAEHLKLQELKHVERRIDRLLRNPRRSLGMLDELMSRRYKLLNPQMEINMPQVTVPSMPQANVPEMPEVTVPAMKQPDMVTPIVTRLDTANEHLSKGVLLLGELTRKESLG
jgi:TP901 family phage tail tape measure protein